MKYKVLYNPLSQNGKGIFPARKIADLLPNDEMEFCDIRTIADFNAYQETLAPSDAIVIAGGDGTLNRFLNLIDGNEVSRRFYYFPAGSGNDFARDVDAASPLIPLFDYAKNLPTVTVGKNTKKFINGVGFGLDGYCCTEGEKQKKKSEKKVNYASIAIKGMLFHFQPLNAQVTVDGTSRSFSRVWLAPTMLGRYYGGGLMIAPNQNRLSEDHAVTLAVLHDCGILRALCIFPLIFFGKHTAFAKRITILQGKEIHVKFDRPTPLQIDGETVEGVTEYSVQASVGSVASENKKKETVSSC